jgi:ketosteroid isomerase-like protein
MIKVQERYKLVGLAIIGLSGIALAKEINSSTTAKDEQAIRAKFAETSQGNAELNLTKAIAMYKAAGDNLLVFDLVPPLEDKGFTKAAIEKTTSFFNGVKAPVVVEYKDLQVHVDHDMAYATYHLHFAFTTKDGKKSDVTGRGTDVFLRVNGDWGVIHEHTSLPTRVGFSWSE